MLNEEFKKELFNLSLNEKKETIKLLSNLLVTNNDTKSLKCPNVNVNKKMLFYGL